MAGWRVAAALEQLLGQLNAAAPHRSKASDGSIGDAAHASRSTASDHNPHWSFAGQAYVTARDFTHDPGGGLDCAQLAAALMQGRDQRVKYVIWNRQIVAGAGGPSPWAWRPYSGPSPHTHHLHLSVVADARALTRIPWLLPGLTSPAPRPTPRGDEFDMATLDELRRIVREEIVKTVGEEIAKTVGPAVWNHPIPDYYRDPQNPPPMPAFAAQGWGAANAGHAVDAARDAADGVDALKTASGPDPAVRYRLVPE